MQDKTLDVRIPHRLDKAEARRRVASAAGHLQSEHAAKIASVEERWEGDRLFLQVSALGQTISGDIDVDQSEVRIRVVLPWLMAKFAEKLRPMIEQQARQRLRLPKPKG